MWIPELGDLVFHVPTEQVFKLTKRSKKAGRVYLWGDDECFVLDNCVPDGPDRQLSSREIEDLTSVCTVVTAEDLELLEALTPLQKRQLWGALPPEVKERLSELRKQIKQVA